MVAAGGTFLDVVGVAAAGAFLLVEGVAFVLVDGLGRMGLSVEMTFLLMLFILVEGGSSLMMMGAAGSLLTPFKIFFNRFSTGASAMPSVFSVP